jgi:hypothetical protein
MALESRVRVPSEVVRGRTGLSRSAEIPSETTVSVPEESDSADIGDLLEVVLFAGCEDGLVAAASALPLRVMSSLCKCIGIWNVEAS